MFLLFCFGRRRFFFFCGSIVVDVDVGSLLFRAPLGVSSSPPDFPLSSLFLTSYRVFVVLL